LQIFLEYSCDVIIPHYVMIPLIIL
jgi:hypothetical protein